MKINLLLALLILSFSVLAQKSESDRQMNQPLEPFKIIGNIYYVGASDVTSFLITTPNGHILNDSGFEETVPQIKAIVAKPRRIVIVERGHVPPEIFAPHIHNWLDETLGKIVN